MNKIDLGRRIVVAALVATMWVLPLAAVAQTRITAPKNKYKLQDDIKLGNQAAVEVERQFPLINDQDAAAYIERVGRRLAEAIPEQFAHPEFNYRFKWVNASDINAFALPGGPMYVNRGMIEAARNEGEMAGVMAHEISHVALRHATAQATKQSSAGNTARTIGLILGGAILGGQTGAQLGQVFAAGFNLKYSREYESQADVLGAQIMADAGYDPRDLANVFKTIQQQQGRSGGPEWLSDHPDPGNRYEKINREASYLRVSDHPIKITRDFERIQAKFRGMPGARSMAQIQSGPRSGRASDGPVASGRYRNNVQLPSTQSRSYSNLSWLRIAVPSNWSALPGENTVTFAPEGAYGEEGITRGVMIGTFSGKNNDLTLDSQEYLNGVLEGNTYLRLSGGSSRTYVDGRQGLSTPLSGRSPLTGRTEIVTIYTAQLRTGELFYAITVVPNDESFNYGSTFRNLIASIRLND